MERFMENFDMLVKLYDLPENHIINPDLEKENIRIHRPMASDRSRIVRYIRENFSEVWADEFEKAMSNTPVSCFVAVKDAKEVIGFSCYDASYRNFFGPIGVSEAYRGKKLGKELLLCALYAMREEGYGYGIIGWSAEKNRLFYEKSAGAVPILDSFPGVYKNSIDIEL